MHLKHAFLCGDSGSSYIFNTPPPITLPVHRNLEHAPHVAIPVHNVP